ncbi:MAG: hypothetical protein JXB38_02255 [Anaerolineales bacterium]|nr:hypothetical protein [Anaerolineales bacterium]
MAKVFHKLQTLLRKPFADKSLRDSLKKGLRPFHLPLVLLIICILAYGVLTPWLGFYWDDWVWIWIGHSQGRSALLNIDQAHRPLSGEVLWLGALLFGENPFGWQFYTLTARWLAGLAAWWMLNQLWPHSKARNAAVTLLICVYPAYTHQFVAVNSSRHVFPLALFFLSIGAMVAAVRKPGWCWPYTTLALASTILAMLTSEYFYGLELLRPLILWIAFSGQEQTPRQQLGKTLRAWLPYLAVLVAVFAWRYQVSKTANYDISLLDKLSAAPWETLSQIITTIVGDAYTAGLAIWVKAFSIPAARNLGAGKIGLLLTLVGSGALLAFASLMAFPAEKRKATGQALLLGAAALLVGGLPAWLTGLEIKLAFPGDRLTLPLAFGAALVAAVLLEALVRWRVVWALLVAVIAGLSIGADFQTAVAYQQDWHLQADFFEQLSWRAPGLEPDTAIVSDVLPYVYDKDDSLSGPLNMIYAPDSPSDRYHILYLDTRLGKAIPALEKGLPITYETHSLQFSGSTDQVLLVYYNPPQCLRILHPVYDVNLHRLPDLLQQALPIATLDPITNAPQATSLTPAQIFGTVPETGWCYYFQKADLARQFRDWDEVVHIAQSAFQLNIEPNHASELVPYIQGYAYTGQYDRALDLTKQAAELNTAPAMQRMLCDAWNDITGHAPASVVREATLGEINAAFNCQTP